MVGPSRASTASLTCVGIREMHETTTGRALAVIALPVGLVVVANVLPLFPQEVQLPSLGTAKTAPRLTKTSSSTLPCPYPGPGQVPMRNRTNFLLRPLWLVDTFFSRDEKALSG